MIAYSFTTSFTVNAPGKDVWEILLNFPAWKSWWPGVRKMSVSNHTAPPTLHVAIGYPFYSLNLALKITDIEIGKRIVFTTSGDLIGNGMFTLTEEKNGTFVAFDWNVATPKLWMNIVASFAKPVFAFSHNLVMHWFVRGLANKLNAPITKVHYHINNPPLTKPQMVKN